MAKAKAAPKSKTSKTTLPPVDGAGEDLGLGDGLDIASDDELGAVLGEGVTGDEDAVDPNSPEFKKAVVEETARQVAAMRKDEPKHEPVIDVDLSATGPHSKEAKIAVTIDEVEGMSNSEEVGVNGKVYQIQRGVVTQVPASVVHVLENAIATRTVQTTDKATGELLSTARDYSSIPWRRV